MRAFATVVLVLSTALLTTACGGPDDPTKSLAEACERQIEEIAEEESGTPTAKSSDERLEAVTLVECAGQKTRVVAADAEGEGSSEGDAKGEGEMPPAEDPTGATMPAGEAGEATTMELDPEARSVFAESCGACHALSDAETSGAVGPGLDETDFDAAAVAERIAEGAPGMPPGLLEGEEATAVADYVAAAAAQAQLAAQ